MALYHTKENVISCLIFSFQILFEGIIGSGSRGDIAVDDVTISYDNCTTLGHESKDGIYTKYGFPVSPFLFSSHSLPPTQSLPSFLPGESLPVPPFLLPSPSLPPSFLTLYPPIQFPKARATKYPNLLVSVNGFTFFTFV